MRVHFLFVGEGTSDEGLINHLELLCVEAGATEVTGVAPDFDRLPAKVGHTVEDKLRAGALLEPEANLLFVHRDADSRTAEHRYEEIEDAIKKSGTDAIVVALVPIQETEAWLLLDESAIRAVAGNPRGKRALGLPRPNAAERLANPKEHLMRALDRASDKSGQRLRKFRRDFALHRRALLAQLPIGGALVEVSAWVRLREDVTEAIIALSQ